MMKASTTFSLPARVLHWVMAAMVLTMLFVGAGMVASVSSRERPVPVQPSWEGRFAAPAASSPGLPGHP